MALDKVDRTLDIRGKICPYTLLETRETIKQLQAGEVLEVICDYAPAAETTIPNFCQKKGYPIESTQEDPGLWKIRIQKTD